MASLSAPRNMLLLAASSYQCDSDVKWCLSASITCILVWFMTDLLIWFRVCSLSFSLHYFWLCLFHWHISETLPLGVSLQPELGETSLDLGELEQVLQDEELARKLQEEEESLVRRVSDSEVYNDKQWLRSQGGKIDDQSPFHSVFWYSLSCSQNSQPSLSSSYPEGDFRAAQVAQDEVWWWTDTLSHTRVSQVYHPPVEWYSAVFLN